MKSVMSKVPRRQAPYLNHLHQNNVVHATKSPNRVLITHGLRRVCITLNICHTTSHLVRKKLMRSAARFGWKSWPTYLLTTTLTFSRWNWNSLKFIANDWSAHWILCSLTIFRVLQRGKAVTLLSAQHRSNIDVRREKETGNNNILQWNKKWCGCLG